ncbi:MAG: rhomboid family intramembrane serine protease [Lachnospiraceae bacterium]|nr:rhomboid family intramembrane serine protease [Lachnospiraceae bacterium]
MTKRREDVPFISILLTGINVVVFLMSLRSKDLLWGKGLLGVSEVLENGEYERMLTSMFLHADAEHLFNNMLILLFLGAMLEKEIGHIRLFVVYMLSGLVGNALSMGMQIVSGDFHYSLGASGGVFGLDGLLLAMAVFAGKRFPHVTPQKVAIMLLLSLYSGFRSSGVDNWAHVGGLLAGFLSGAVICFILYRKDRRTISEY